MDWDCDWYWNRVKYIGRSNHPPPPPPSLAATTYWIPILTLTLHIPVCKILSSNHTLFKYYSHSNQLPTCIHCAGLLHCMSDWWSRGQRFAPNQVHQYSFMGIDHETFFLLSFSPFCWFKKGSCQFLAKEYAQVLADYLENYPASILRKSTSGRHRPVSYPDGPMTARYRLT